MQPYPRNRFVAETVDMNGTGMCIHEKMMLAVMMMAAALAAIGHWVLGWF